MAYKIEIADGHDFEYKESWNISVKYDEESGTYRATFLDADADGFGDTELEAVNDLVRANQRENQQIRIIEEV